MENNTHTRNVTGWLHALLCSGRVTVTADQAEYVVQAKEWLSAVNKGKLLVAECQPEQVTDQPSSGEA